MDSFTTFGIHNHQPDFNMVEKKEKIQKMKDFFIGKNFSVRTTVSRVLRGANTNTIQNVGSLECLYKILRTYRNPVLNLLLYMYPDLKLELLLHKPLEDRFFFNVG